MRLKLSGLVRLAGTGTLKGLKGAGALHIKSASPSDRIFILDGQRVAAHP